MKLHQREKQANRAKYKFGFDATNYLILTNVDEYADIYYVFNEIERYWIACGRRQLSEADAVFGWPSYILPDDSLSPALKTIGDMFAVTVSEYQLSYGEIASILSSVMSHEAKFHIRAERHPYNSDKPGGLE